MKDQEKEERIFFKEELVLVTSTRFVVGSKTYAMRNISSVSNYELKESLTKKWGVTILVFGLVLLGLSKLFGLILIGVGLFLIFDKQFCVRINSNSGEAKELISRNKMYVQKIVDAISDAIIYRG